MISWVINNRFEDCTSTTEDGNIEAPSWFFPWNSDEAKVTLFGDNVDCHNNYLDDEDINETMLKDVMYFRIVKLEQFKQPVTEYTGEIQFHGLTLTRIPKSLEDFVNGLNERSDDPNFSRPYVLQTGSLAQAKSGCFPFA
jgi:hypothetical protein